MVQAGPAAVNRPRHGGGEASGRDHRAGRRCGLVCLSIALPTQHRWANFWRVAAGATILPGCSCLAVRAGGR